MTPTAPAAAHEDAALTAGAGETLDAICAGQVRILQRERGYRFNLDPILLAHFAHASGRGLRGRVIDLGTGTGIIPLLLARKFGHRELWGVELQPALYELARRNVRLNACGGAVHIEHGDLREAPKRFGRGTFSHVIANPPYGAAHGGKLNPQPERAIARHEVTCSMTDLTRAASELLRDGGSVWLVYPAQRTLELFEALRAEHLRPRRLQAVHPRLKTKARLVMVQAVKRGRAALTVCPPLLLHVEGKPGFSEPVEAMLAPRHP